HLESTLLQVLILEQLIVPLESIPFEKQGEGSPLWLTNCSKKLSTDLSPLPPIVYSHPDTTASPQLFWNQQVPHSFHRDGGEGGAAVVFPRQTFRYRPIQLNPERLLDAQPIAARTANSTRARASSSLPTN